MWYTTNATVYTHYCITGCGQLIKTFAQVSPGFMCYRCKEQEKGNMEAYIAWLKGLRQVQQQKEEQMEGRKFWLVWCPLAANPSCRHGSREMAQAEAVRLARANIGKEFFVTEVIERVVVEPTQPTIEHLR